MTLSSHSCRHLLGLGWGDFHAGGEFWESQPAFFLAGQQKQQTWALYDLYDPRISDPILFVIPSGCDSFCDDILLQDDAELDTAQWPGELRCMLIGTSFQARPLNRGSQMRQIFHSASTRGHLD